MYVRNICIYEHYGTLEEFILKYVPSALENKVLTLESKEISPNNTSIYQDKIVVIENLENEKNLDLLPFFRATSKQNVLILIYSRNICQLNKVYEQEWKDFICMLSYPQWDKGCIFYGATGKKG